MASAAELYEFYNAIKQHFKTKQYDYFKYKGRLRLGDFKNNKGKIFFEILAKDINSKEIIFSNILKNPDIWISEIANTTKARDVFHDWDKRTTAISYYFKLDLKELNLDFPSNFKKIDGENPKIFSLLIQEKISLETFIILDKITGFINRLDKSMNDDILWNKTIFKIKKYEPFLKINNLNKFKRIILDEFLNYK